MRAWTLAELEAAVRDSWDADTCDPAEDGGWSAAVPSRGQCVATAAVLHDLLGGELLIARVYSGGEPRGFHGWNRLASGVEIDLTRDQFRPDESLGQARVVERPPGGVLRIQDQYELLLQRVTTRLGG